MVYDIESLDDLYQAFYSGEIDYSTFTTLSDAYDNRGLIYADLEALGIYERNYFGGLSAPDTDNRFWSRVISNPAGRIEARRYSRNLDEITDYFYLDLKKGVFEARTDFKRSDDNYIVNNRSFSWEKDNVSVTLGNFIAAEGFGLAIGRFEYRPVVGLDSKDDFDFMYPMNSYYNGLRIATGSGRLSGRAYYSEKKYGEAFKSFYGSGLDFVEGAVKIGAAVGLNRFKNHGVEKNTVAAGLNFESRRENYSLAGEYAVVEKSGGLFLRSQCRLADFILAAEFWHYADNFYSFNCTGPAASDYESFFPNQDELGFRSSQAGETGMTYNYMSGNLKTGVQFWSHSDEPDINSSYNFKYAVKLFDRLDASFQTFSKIRNSGGYLWSKLILITDWPLINKTGFKTYFVGKNRFVNYNSYYFIYLKKNLNDNAGFFLNVRSYFDGRLTWFLGEDLKIAAGLDLSVEITRDKYTKLNLRIEKGL